MKTIVLRVDDETSDKLKILLSLLSKNKFDFEILDSENESILLKEEEKKNIWDFLLDNAGTIDGNEDESVEHDHYIRGSEKKFTK